MNDLDSCNGRGRWSILRFGEVMKSGSVSNCLHCMFKMGEGGKKKSLTYLPDNAQKGRMKCLRMKLC